MGPAQLVAGPAPEWLQGVAAVLGLAIPVASIANAVNLALTIGPEWRNIGRRPILASAMAGAGMAAIAGIVTGIAGFRSAAVLVAFTPFWEGVIYLLVFGAVILLFASFAWLAIPTLVGRMIDSQTRASKLVRRNVLAAGGTFLFLMLAGIAAGYGWAGAAYSGLVENIGEGWAQTSGFPSVLFGIALVFATLGLLAQLGFCLSIYRSLTSGRATIQEVLIAEEEPRASERSRCRCCRHGSARSAGEALRRSSGQSHRGIGRRDPGGVGGRRTCAGGRTERSGPGRRQSLQTPDAT